MTDETFSLGFTFRVLCSSKHVIEGIASLPTVDREHEVVMKSAIAGALEGFMELPILHIQHTERPVGLVTKAEVRPEGLYIRAVIREKNGAHDVWDRIEKGDLSKFSIYGRRIKYSPECRVSAYARSESTPCITKSLYLDSISIVETSSAVNQGTWLNIVKAIIDDRDNYILPEQSTETIIQNVPERGTKMVDNIENPPDVEGGTPPTDTLPVEKAEVPADTVLVSAITELNKAVVTLTDRMTAVPETPPVEKAEAHKDAPPDVEALVKARVTSELTEIVKGFDAKVAELTARIEKMEEETVKKGMDVVVIPDLTMPTGYGNAAAIRKFDEV